ncbi:hypothetical protein ALQ34_200057 [Pseudomonas syringae pv. maculicola]|nr:hypothetical protein ALQ34_200057 [Pseudomonas syringae pv. maculicola]
MISKATTTDRLGLLGGEPATRHEVDRLRQTQLNPRKTQQICRSGTPQAQPSNVGSRP